MRDIWTIPIAGLVAGVAGFLFGFPALRLTGLYLALATFAIAVAAPAVVKKFEGFTGGGGGINLFDAHDPDARPTSITDPVTFEDEELGVNILGIDIPTFNEWLYYLCWTVALVMFAAAWLLLRGRFGRSLRAVRDSELAAASSGVNLARYKTLAFGISAFYAGVAGSLLAIATTFVNPDTFPITLSIFLLVGVVVGGLGSLWPLVFGAIFIHFMQIEWAQRSRGGRSPTSSRSSATSTPTCRARRGRLRRRPDPDHARVPGRRRRAAPQPEVARDAAATIAFAEPRLKEPLMLRPSSSCLLALAGAIATGATAASGADPGVTANDDPARRHRAALRPASAYASVAAARARTSGT